jgi:hypothetical protein
MKKKLALLLSFFTLVAFVTVNVANAQSPKTDKQSAKVEQTVEKKAAEPCCETKGQATASVKSGCCTADAKAAAAKSGCCSSDTKAASAEARGGEAKSGCATAGKTCGGCSSKTSTQSAEQLPVPKR